MEHESPQALEYLRTDCHNINIFFRKQGVSTLTLRELFEWVVNPSLPAPDDASSKECLMSLLREASIRGLNETIEKEDEAFRYVHIPRNLSVSYPFVRDFLKIQRGQLSHSDIYYAAITGLKPDLTGILTQPQVIKENNGCESDNESITDKASITSGISFESISEDVIKAKNNARPRNESPESRRNRKKAIKQEQAEKRKHKIPKYIKRRKIKK